MEGRNRMNDFKEIDAQSTEESRHSENRFLRNKYRVPDENGRPSSFLRRVYNGTLARASDSWLNNQLRANFPKGGSSLQKVTSFSTPGLTSEDPDPSPEIDDDRRTCCTAVWIFLGITLILALGGGVMMIVMILSLSDENISGMCEETRFGKRCEHKCHCVNTSERCDQHSGVCKSGCISGWTGNSCQIITSVFDKSAVHVRLPSNETFQCSIKKLWYNWTSVQLAFLNETNTFIMVTVSQDGSTSFTDPRISVSLSSGNGADNVTFAFNLSEYSCDLEGLYECQFQMENNFTTQFGNTSVSFSAPPSNVSVIVQSENSNDVMDDTVNCTGTIHLNTTTLRLVAMSNGTDLAAGQNITRLLLESEMTSDCRHHVLVVYTGNFSSLAGRNVSCRAEDLVYGDNYFSTEEIINVKTTA
uniref:Uncharacterized protein LOC111100039 n=1 Tax=Crassostrea virginica TaxID=6565 RepID=A0A8B8ABN9_CRAVI|nr:uncharacterized protein LOC111100039 [Crassostrea virginica]